MDGQPNEIELAAEMSERNRINRRLSIISLLRCPPQVPSAETLSECISLVIAETAGLEPDAARASIGHIYRTDDARYAIIFAHPFRFACLS